MTRLIRRGAEARTAAKKWTALKAAPVPGKAYLIAADYGGIETFDVAFYNGCRRDGSHWWTLGNSDISHECIRLYAEINAVSEPSP